MYTIDLKNNHGSVIQGKGLDRADTVIMIADEDFVSLAKGKLNGNILCKKNTKWYIYNFHAIGQKAFMLGKLKIKGQMILATKLDTIFKQLVGKSKL